MTYRTKEQITTELVQRVRELERIGHDRGAILASIKHQEGVPIATLEAVRKELEA